MWSQILFTSDRSETWPSTQMTLAFGLAWCSSSIKGLNDCSLSLRPMTYALKLIPTSATAASVIFPIPAVPPTNTATRGTEDSSIWLLLFLIKETFTIFGSYSGGCSLESRIKIRSFIPRGVLGRSDRGREADDADHSPCENTDVKAREAKGLTCAILAKLNP